MCPAECQSLRASLVLLPILGGRLACSGRCVSGSASLAIRLACLVAISQQVEGRVDVSTQRISLSRTRVDLAAASKTTNNGRAGRGVSLEASRAQPMSLMGRLQALPPRSRLKPPFAFDRRVADARVCLGVFGLSTPARRARPKVLDAGLSRLDKPRDVAPLRRRSLFNLFDGMHVGALGALQFSAICAACFLVGHGAGHACTAQWPNRRSRRHAGGGGRRGDFSWPAVRRSTPLKNRRHDRAHEQLWWIRPSALMVAASSSGDATISFVARVAWLSGRSLRGGDRMGSGGHAVVTRPGGAVRMRRRRHVAMAFYRRPRSRRARGAKPWKTVMGPSMFWRPAYLPHRVVVRCARRRRPVGGERGRRDVRWSRKGRIRQGRCSNF
jgi:hypothetical protein